jgi:hypothetical protein
MPCWLNSHRWKNKSRGRLSSLLLTRAQTDTVTRMKVAGMNVPPFAPWF